MRNNVDDRLYAIALQCAEFNIAGCANNCSQCQFNVFNYVKDVREASLLKANAYTDVYHSLQRDERLEKEKTDRAIGSGFLILFVIGIFWLCGAGLKSCFAPKDLINKTPEVQYLLEHPNQTENIPRVFAALPHVLHDWNKDGKINCIDYSLSFRYLYGSDAQLYSNLNYFTNMNHMFIVIYLYRLDIKDIVLEPQAKSDNYSMESYWGREYDPKYNSNVTRTYERYLK